MIQKLTTNVSDTNNLKIQHLNNNNNNNLKNRANEPRNLVQ